MDMLMGWNGSSGGLVMEVGGGGCDSDVRMMIVLADNHVAILVMFLCDICMGKRRI